MSKDRKKRNPAERLCPKCRDRMHERPLQASGVKIDACPTCHGMWFDRYELEGHLGGPDAEVVPAADAAVSNRCCPKCGVQMTSFVASGSDVTIDLCEECKGVWLDAGELKRLEQGARQPAGILTSLRNMLGL